jgi:hypothetical protein
VGDREIHKIPVNELDSLMANFIIAAKKKNGFDYEPTSLRGIISSIDRKLRRHRYGHYIGGYKISSSESVIGCALLDLFPFPCFFNNFILAFRVSFVSGNLVCFSSPPI